MAPAQKGASRGGRGGRGRGGRGGKFRSTGGGRNAAPAVVEEVTYDENDRQDFLTGFHKRKLEQKRLARERAIKREKDEKREFRKENNKLHLVQDELNRIEAVNNPGVVREDIGSDEEGTEPLRKETKTETTQRVTTVTISEWDPNDEDYGVEQRTQASDDGDEERPVPEKTPEVKPEKAPAKTGKGKPGKRRPSSGKAVMKKKSTGGRVEKKKPGGKFKVLSQGRALRKATASKRK
ncbi:hypothetical protein DFS34DRAFT_648297 [Phlyctochytrium arcticum]|nr:hypothetical protein DFS34DRAFT_648297 [Phlyctochytrium arcticum]